MKRALSTYLRLARLARGELRLTGAATACFLLATAADVGLLLMLKRLVDAALATDGLGPLATPLLAALGLVLARESAAYAAGWLEIRAETSLNVTLQHRLFGHLHTLSLGFLERREPGRLLAQLFQEVPAAARLVLQVTRSAIQAPARATLLFGVLFFLDAGTALLATLVVLPAFVLSRVLGSSLRSGYERFFEAVSALYARAEESFATIELVKVFDRSEREVGTFRRELDGHARQWQRLYRLSALEGPAQRAIQMAALAVFFGYGARAVSQGSLSAGTFTSALVATYAYLSSLQPLASLYTAAQQGLVAAQKMFELLDEQPKLVSPPHGTLASFNRGLALENVVFAYPGREPILDRLTLSLRRGERVALLGRSGVGKTTLLRLLLRLYDPSQGSVSFDGVDARELDLASLYRLFSVVLQDSPVITGTIRQNITYGSDDASPEAVGEAAELAGLEGLLARSPDGLDSVVGSRGLALSGGERQRIALARAALRNAPILLLDEATSHLDSVSERQVQLSLDRLTRDRTVLTVAHRLSTLMDAERIVFLEAGRVSAEGRHDELLRTCEGYARQCAALGLSAT